MSKNNELIKRYSNLKIQQKLIERELNTIKSSVMAIVSEEEDELLQTKWGKFELRPGRKKWKYSDALLLKEQQVKEAIKSKKTQEELNNTAVLEKAPTSLVFTMEKK